MICLADMDLDKNIAHEGIQVVKVRILRARLLYASCMKVIIIVKLTILNSLACYVKVLVVTIYYGREIINRINEKDADANQSNQAREDG